MDKAAIRARAEETYSRLGHYSRSGGDDVDEIEAALTQAVNETVEAALDVLGCFDLSAAPVIAARVRRLRIEKGE